jgi:Flp pilus assembly protein TadG
MRRFVPHHVVADDRGGISILFAFVALPLAAMAGLALDYSQAIRAEKSMQVALDAAALAAAQALATGDVDPDTAAQQFFGRNFTARGAAPSPVVTVEVEADARRVTTHGRAEVPTNFARLFGIEKFEIGGRARAEFGISKSEVALVLDNTGSMSGAKLDALKAAARDLVESLYDAPSADQNIKVALVPFAQYVNVGLANRSASWLDVANDSSTTTNQCYDTYPNATSSNCHDVTTTCTNDGVSYPCTYTSCDWDYGSPVQTCSDVTSYNTWAGCVGSRAHPLDVSTAADFSTRVPGLMNTACPSELTRLTNSHDDIVAKIDAMVATGETFVQPGVIWGWRALDWNEPFADGVDPASERGLKKYMVVMTDGANTKSPLYPNHDGGDAVLANSLTGEVCTAVKAKGVTIYTVAFDVVEPTIQALLQSCASSATNYYQASDAAALSDAFKKIADAMKVVHLSN